MNDKVFENLIKIASDKFGLVRKKDIANKIGATSQKMTNWKNRGLPTAEYTNISERLGITIDQLVNYNLALNELPGLYNVSPAPAIKPGQVPVISWVQAGNACEAIDLFEPGSADDWVTPTVNIKAHTYALRIQGDSMEPKYYEGMKIVVEPEMDYHSGSLVIAKNENNEVTFKQYVKDGGQEFLKPLNPQYPIIPMGTFKVIGVVRQAIIDIC